MIYAEEVNYWKTSRSGSDSWIDKAKREIRQIDGEILGEIFGSETVSGRSAFMLAFRIDENQFKLVWPVLASKTGNEKAAKVQAATALFHDVKARCVAAKFIGSRGAFFNALMLPDGRTVSEIVPDEISELLPEIIGHRLLSAKGER